MLRSPDSISKNDQIIEDPQMEPFFLTKAVTGGFTVFKRVEKGEKNKKYIETICYPSTFNSALKVVAKEQLNYSSKKKFNSVREYLDEWKAIKAEMELIANIQ